MLRATDNNCGKNIKGDKFTVTQNKVEDFNKIANVRIKDIKLEENPNLLIFPYSFDDCKDKVYDEVIFNLQDDILTTGNVMGFVGVNESELTIHSRFSKNEEEEKEDDYFLHYMLQKVFSINLFNLKHSSSKENIFDFLIYLFPYFLKKALAQGLYKEYQKNSYNDANVRGSIDVNAHIRSNIPFNGKIAYRVREHNYDNKITQLIRHTIELIKKHEFANKVLTNDADTQSCVMQIVQSTPAYDFNQRRLVINNNLRPLIHPYYSEYKDLQRICMQILRYEGLKFGENNDKVYGLLFDGAWLWEEYLFTILKDCNFNHPENMTSQGAIYLFSNPKRGVRYPDFWKKNFILDAKYKNLSGGIDRNDMNQIISYMYVQNALVGGFLYPSKNTSEVVCKSIGKLNGYGGFVKKWSMPIPQNANSFNMFCSLMAEKESSLKELIAMQETSIVNKIQSS